MDADRKLLLQTKLVEYLILSISHMVEDVMDLDMGKPEVRALIHEVLVDLAQTMPEEFTPRAQLLAEIEASEEPKN